MLKMTDDYKGLSVPYPEVGVENGVYGIYVQNGEKIEFEPCGKYIHHACEVTDIETGERTYRLSFREEICDISLNELTKDSLKILKKYGITVDVPVLIKMIENDISQHKKITYSSLGFDETIQDTPVFKGAKAIGTDAYYQGEYSVHPEGSISEWRRLCYSEIIDSIPMTFIFCASTAGVISDWLKGDTINIHLVGKEDSEYTKLAGDFGLACGGKSRRFDDGYNPLCFVENIGNSYPCLIDGITSIEDCPNIFENPEIHTTFFAVSSAKTDKNVVDNSCAVPWLEFSGIQWMDRYLAYCINSVISKNYGIWIPIVAKRLITWGKLKTKYRTERAKERFKKYAKKHGAFQNMPETIYNQISMIITAFEVIIEEFGIIDKEYDVIVDKRDLLEFIIQNASVEWYEYKKSDNADGETLIAKGGE